MHDARGGCLEQRWRYFAFSLLLSPLVCFCSGSFDQAVSGTENGVSSHRVVVGVDQCTNTLSYCPAAS